MNCSDVLSFQAWVVSLLVTAVESRHMIKPLGCRTRANYVFVAKKQKEGAAYYDGVEEGKDNRHFLKSNGRVLLRNILSI